MTIEGLQPTKTYRCYNCGKRRYKAVDPPIGHKRIKICNCGVGWVSYCCPDKQIYEPEHRVDQMRRTHRCKAPYSLHDER